MMDDRITCLYNKPGTTTLYSIHCAISHLGKGSQGFFCLSSLLVGKLTVYVTYIVVPPLCNYQFSEHSVTHIVEMLVPLEYCLRCTFY